MAIRNLLYNRSYAINNYISIVIPTVGEIIDQEESYYNLVSLLTMMPIDMMVQLEDIGIDFTTITDYDLFLLMFANIKLQDTSLIFGDLNLPDFEYQVNEENRNLILINKKNSDIRIDRAIYGQISGILRKIHHIEQNRSRPANDEAKEFMLKRARAKMRRIKNRTTDSWLETLIIAMVNTEQYKYDFEGTRQLSIYQFNESVRQVIKKVDYDNKMYGVCAGTINAKELSQDDLNWLTHK